MKIFRKRTERKAWLEAQATATNMPITDAGGYFSAVGISVEASLQEIGLCLGISVASGVLAVEEKTPVNAIASAGKLTSSGAMVPASHAETVLTSDATNPVDGKITTVGTTVYRWKTTMAQAFDVKIGASAAVSLDNLKAAINLTGTEGVEYYAGTTAHPDVVATDNADTTQKIVARVPGVDANSIVTTEDSDHLSWADTTLGGGTGASTAGVTDAAATITINGREYMFVTALSETSGADPIVDQILYGGSEAAALDNMKLAINAGATEGTEYSTGTVVNVDVTAGTNTDTTQVITSKVKGVLGDLITTTETLANTVWDDVTLGTEVAGVDGTVAVKGEKRFDSSYEYTCVDTNTIADDNWRRVSLGSAY